MQIMASANPIERSFELAAERCEDLTPLVYRRLFREHPEAENDVPQRGQRARQGLDAGADDRGDPGFRRPNGTGHFRLIECEVSSHDAYGTPRELFVAFFGVIAATLREILGADWSPEIDAAWRKLLAEVEGVVRSQP